jgi:hypothetical protein
MTTTLAAFDPRYRDPRIRLAVSIAGPTRNFSKNYFSQNQIPYLMVAGDQDVIVDYRANALDVREKDPDSVLVTLRGGSHTGFAGVSRYLFRWVNHPDTLGCRSVTSNIRPNEGYPSELYSATHGVEPAERLRFCEGLENMPRAMRPEVQHMYTTLAVFGFIDSLFADDSAIRVKRKHFLTRFFDKENEQVTVDAGDYKL